MVPRILPIDGADDLAVALEASIEALRSGRLVAFPTDTVYGLAADASNAAAVAALYVAKGREEAKPVPVLVSDVGSACALAAPPKDSLAALGHRFWPGPLTVVVRAAPGCTLTARAADGTIALRVPDHPFALALLRRMGGPLAVTSANRSGEPAARRAAEVVSALIASVSVIVDAPCGGQPSASTVVTVATPSPRIIRTGPIPAGLIAEALGTAVTEPDGLP